MELELIEPDLGLRLSPDSAEALASAILAVDAGIASRLALGGPLGHDADT